MPETNKKKELTIYYNDALPAISADNLALSSRSDGLHLLRFLLMTPEGALREQGRIMVSDQALRNMLKLLCAQLHYLPEKDTPSKKTVKKSGTGKKAVASPRN